MTAADQAFLLVPAPADPVEHAPTGPLHGLAFVAEDVFDVAGYPVGAGRPSALLASPVQHTASMVQTMLDAGARLAGKTPTDAIGRTLDGAAHRHGTRAGSSSAALAVAEDLAEIGLLADVKGAVMASAGHLGLVGLRCTHGRVTLDNCVVPAPSLISAGLVARAFEPLIRAAELLLGADAAPLPGDPRLLLAADGFATLSGETRERFAPALRRAEAVLGPAKLVESAAEGTEVLGLALDVLHGREVWDTHGAVLDRLDPTLGAWIGGEHWSEARARAGREVAGAERRRAAFTRRFADLVGADGVLLLPTLPSPGPEGSSEGHGGLSLAVLSGLPQVSLPLPASGLGLSLIGPRGSDLGLLRLAARLLEEFR